MVDAEGHNPALRHGPFFSPAVFPVSPLVAPWKLTYPTASQLPQTEPSSVFWSQIPSNPLPPSSFVNFSPTAKLGVICSRHTMLQHELFRSHPLREGRVNSILPTLNCCCQPLISQRCSIFGSFYDSLKQRLTFKAY